MEANYFTILYWFCHTSTWIRHGCTRVPHPEPPSLPVPSLWVIPVHSQTVYFHISLTIGCQLQGKLPRVINWWCLYGNWKTEQWIFSKHLEAFRIAPWWLQERRQEDRRTDAWLAIWVFTDFIQFLWFFRGTWLGATKLKYEVMWEDKHLNKVPLGIDSSTPALLKKLICKWIFFTMFFSVITLCNLSFFKFVSLLLQGVA